MGLITASVVVYVKDKPTTKDIKAAEAFLKTVKKSEVKCDD